MLVHRYNFHQKFPSFIITKKKKEIIASPYVYPQTSDRWTNKWLLCIPKFDFFDRFRSTKILQRLSQLHIRTGRILSRRQNKKDKKERKKKNEFVKLQRRRVWLYDVACNRSANKIILMYNFLANVITALKLYLICWRRHLRAIFIVIREYYRFLGWKLPSPTISTNY